MLRNTKWLFVSSLLLLIVTGCGASFSSSGDSHSSSIGVVQGMVHGGQQPVSGARVYVLQAGTSGYGGASVSLLRDVSGVTHADTTTFPGSTAYYVTTAGDGSFSLTGNYTCTAGTQEYVYAIGGSSNNGQSTNNAIGMLAGLGECPGTGTLASNVPYVFVNEVSTVITAYALAGFATDATHISSSGTALAKTGVANAMANVANLLNVATGEAQPTTTATNSSGTVPVQKINTLANILASCVNTSDSGSPQCNTLLTAATSDGTTLGTKPADTATAVLNIAHHSASNVAALFGLMPGTGAPFPNALSSQPSDFSLAIKLSAPSLEGSNQLAIDAAGNAWVTDTNHGLTKFSPQGVVLSGAGYTYAGDGGVEDLQGIAIDPSGNAWTTDTANDALRKWSPTGSAVSGTGGYTGGGLSQPFSLAIDAGGKVWVGNIKGTAFSGFDASGTALTTSSGYITSSPIYGIAVDGAGNLWLTQNDSVKKYTTAGVNLSGPGGFTGGGLATPQSIAVDGEGNAWVGNSGGVTFSGFNNSGTALSPTGGYSGIVTPRTTSVDGDGHIWLGGPTGLAGYSSGGVALSSAAAFPSVISFLAIDGSGNLWATSGSGYVTEFLGASAPVVTPICAGLPATPTADGTSLLGTRP